MGQDRDAGGRAMLAGLLDASHLMPVEALADKTAEEVRAAGFSEVLIYVADLTARGLHLLPGRRGAGAQGEPAIAIDGTAAGRAFQYGDLVPAAPADASGAHWWVPLVDGTERVGVLRVTSRNDDARARQDANRLAALLALIIVGKQESSDTLARLMRNEPMTVAAEMQWNLMPQRTYADGRVVIAASMEPAYEISGDAYEYALDGPLVHLTIFDAMGHDTAAGLCAGLALGACRNARRQGADLISKGEAVEAALIGQYGRERYVTGILATLDTRSGLLAWINRGHLPPILIRDNRWTSHLDCTPASSHGHRPRSGHHGLPRAVATRGPHRPVHRRHHRGPPPGWGRIRPGPLHRLPHPPPRRRPPAPGDLAPASSTPCSTTTRDGFRTMPPS